MLIAGLIYLEAQLRRSINKAEAEQRGGLTRQRKHEELRRPYGTCLESIVPGDEEMVIKEFERRYQGPTSSSSGEDYQTEPVFVRGSLVR